MTTNWFIELIGEDGTPLFIDARSIVCISPHASGSTIDYDIPEARRQNLVALAAIGRAEPALCRVWSQTPTHIVNEKRLHALGL